MLLQYQDREESGGIFMPYQMTDIHMHLIPGVDDGAMDRNMALGMAFLAWNQGIKKIFLTPHSSAFDQNPETVRERYEQLKDRVSRLLPELSLYPGCEVLCDSCHMEAVLVSLAAGRYPTMNGTRYILAEFSMWAREDAACECANALIGAGWKPIIAHMERYPYLREKMALVDRLREWGCRVQVNAYSLFEESDEAIKSWARRLVLEKKVDFLGTDAHRTYHRPPCAELGLQWLYENYDSDFADAIAWKNADRLLIGEERHHGTV